MSINQNETFYQFSLKNNKGEEVPMSKFKGKVVLVVNTAGQCGFTPQYEGLEKMYQEFKDRGLEILAVPCNQFGGQEPGNDQEIAHFCQMNYGITFPLFSKTDVNGDHAHPLFQYLKKTLPGLLGSEAIKWNFTKFLIDQNGHPLKRFAPTDTPATIQKEIQTMLK